MMKSEAVNGGFFYCLSDVSIDIGLLHLNHVQSGTLAPVLILEGWCTLERHLGNISSLILST